MYTINKKIWYASENKNYYTRPEFHGTFSRLNKRVLISVQMLSVILFNAFLF